MTELALDMTGRRFLKAATFAAFTVTAGLACNHTGPAAPATPITLDDVHERGIAGRLGPRLGTVVEVRGVVIANHRTDKRGSLEPFLLQIESVDGEKLTKPVEFAASEMRLRELIPSLKVGDSFHCVGYETGDFRGTAEGDWKNKWLFADSSFRFHIDFRVLEPGGRK